MNEYGKHCASVSATCYSVTSIRRRLTLERHLPPGVKHTPENLPCRSGATYNIRAVNFDDALACAQRHQERDDRR